VGLLAALVGALVASPAHAAPGEQEMFCDVPGQQLAISPISGLSDGQSVTWLSTVKGTTPTEFTGTYVGKIDNALGYDADGKPRDLLLVKLGGDIVNGTADSLPAGVWAGASGSPVYDEDGALIGAVSYGFSWLADNVAGVTPAAYMKQIGQLPSSKKLSSAARAAVESLVGDAPTSAAGTATIRQLQPVRVTTGTTAATLDALSSGLAKRVASYKPAALSGRAIDGGASSGADYPIVAGGNIAVSYAYGAVGSASVGTVTAVCGDQVFAYGHPGNWNSALGANIHGASAARIVPDFGGAYKLVSAIGKVKGKLVDDRLAGVRALLGTSAATIPITTVSDIGDHRSKAVSHVSEKLLVAPAAAAQIGTDALRMLDNQWEGTAKLSWTIEYQRENGTKGTLNNVNRYSSAEGLPDLIGWDLAEDIAQLQANPFEEVKVLKVRIKAVFTEGYRAARVSGVQILRDGTWKKISSGAIVKVKRGETYSFRTVLSPVPGSTRVTEYRPFTVSIPKSIKNRMAISLAAPTPQYEEDMPASFDALVAALDDNQRFDVIDRRRVFFTKDGTKYVREATMVAPTVVVDEGKKFSFKLQATT
jgi:hypothetical protein